MTQTIDTPVAFDPDKFRQTTRAQWESAAEAWDRWSPLLGEWLGPATDAMLDMAAVGSGPPRVLDVAAGAGGDVEVRRVDSPVRLPSAAECVRFERESFGALHQMMAAMSERARAETWQEIEAALGKFETDQGFVGPCEMLVGAGTK